MINEAETITWKKSFVWSISEINENDEEDNNVSEIKWKSWKAKS